MNRAQRRQIERAVKRRSLKHPVPGSVALRGGPMDGWVVKPDAPALEPGWRAKYLEELARSAYERTRLEFAAAHGIPIDDPAVPPAWEAIDEVKREQYRAIIRREKGDGRYVQVEDAPLPVAKWEAE